MITTQVMTGVAPVRRISLPLCSITLTRLWRVAFANYSRRTHLRLNVLIATPLWTAITGLLLFHLSFSNSYVFKYFFLFFTLSIYSVYSVIIIRLGLAHITNYSQHLILLYFANEEVFPNSEAQSCRLCFRFLSCQSICENRLTSTITITFKITV